MTRHGHCSIRTDLYLLACRRDDCGRCGSLGPRRHRPCQWTPLWQSPDRWLSGRGSSRTEDLPKTKHHVGSAWLYGCYVSIYMYMYVADAERPTLWQSNLNARAPTSTSLDTRIMGMYRRYHNANRIYDIRLCVQQNMYMYMITSHRAMLHVYQNRLYVDDLIFVSIAFSKSSLSKYMTMTLCAWRNFRVLNYVTSACFVAVLLTLLLALYAKLMNGYICSIHNTIRGRIKRSMSHTWRAWRHRSFVLVHDCLINTH